MSQFVADAPQFWSGWHKVKETASSKEIELSSEVDRGATRQLDSCELLTKQDLAQVLSLPIERSEGTGRPTLYLPQRR